MEYKSIPATLPIFHERRMKSCILSERRYPSIATLIVLRSRQEESSIGASAAQVTRSPAAVIASDRAMQTRSAAMMTNRSSRPSCPAAAAYRSRIPGRGMT